MCVLCLWELTQRDSSAQVVLALFFFFAMSITLFWAAWKVIRLAKQSATLHQNPGYFLYADPAALNKWGFLYVQFRATAYYFILPVLVYTLVKGAFIGLAQQSGKLQAIALVIIELTFLVGVSILRPWMDKKTNTFNIAIAAINFVNVIFLLIFTEIFKQQVGSVNYTAWCDYRAYTISFCV
jgi:flagellar biosynthesis protein FliQ